MPPKSDRACKRRSVLAPAAAWYPHQSIQITQKEDQPATKIFSACEARTSLIDCRFVGSPLLSVYLTIHTFLSSFSFVSDTCYHSCVSRCDAGHRTIKTRSTLIYNGCVKEIDNDGVIELFKVERIGETKEFPNISSHAGEVLIRLKSCYEKNASFACFTDFIDLLTVVRNVCQLYTSPPIISFSVVWSS